MAVISSGSPMTSLNSGVTSDPNKLGPWSTWRIVLWNLSGYRNITYITTKICRHTQTAKTENSSFQPKIGWEDTSVGGHAEYWPQSVCCAPKSWRHERLSSLKPRCSTWERGISYTYIHACMQTNINDIKWNNLEKNLSDSSSLSIRLKSNMS